MSHFSILGGGSKRHLRAKKKHIHHLVWVTHGKVLINTKICGGKKSPHPIQQQQQNSMAVTLKQLNLVINKVNLSVLNLEKRYLHQNGVEFNQKQKA